MKREDGFYWVKTLSGKWTICRWFSGDEDFSPCWDIIGDEREFSDNDFSYIGDKIEKPED